MKTIYLVHVTTGTHDWEHVERHVVTELDKVKHMESEDYKNKQLLGDVEYADVEITLLTDKEQLYSHLTIEELFEVYPPTKSFLDRYFNAFEPGEG